VNAPRAPDGPLHVHHVNLQTIVAGGESFTRSFTRALQDVGVGVTLYVNRENRFWDTMDGVEVVRVADVHELEQRLPRSRSWVLLQTAIAPEDVDLLAARHAVVGVAHMSPYNRPPGWLAHCAHVITVSLHCVSLLREAGLKQLYPEPMYAVPDVRRAEAPGRIVARSPYRWDRNKPRDVLLGLLEPLLEPLRRRPVFERLPGLTLGIVSQIVPIKQFPLLFSLLAPILARHDVNLEIVGAGGYAQVRDLKRALAPLRGRVRFWGHQRDVASVYPKLDYLLAGLPEMEALGLNVLEAQSCGTPVLAPRAAPFTETMQEPLSGFLYRDPRQDQGADFERVIKMILQEKKRPDPREAREHLARFSYAALVERTRRFVSFLGSLPQAAPSCAS